MDIIFQDAFDKLILKNFDLQTYKEELIRFFGEKVHLGGYVTLHLTLGSQPQIWIVKVDCLVVDYPSAYNVILGSPTLNKIGAIIFMACLIIKFFTNNREIAIVRADQAVAHQCYNVSLKI